MLTKPLDQITAEDVGSFIAAKLQESAVLDYKRDYDLKVEKQKKAFLGDICAFANNGGGHIIIGIDKDGQNDDLPANPPVGAKKFTKSVAEDTLHNSIDPRIGSFVEICEVTGQWGAVYVVRIKRTWNPPHCVTSSVNRAYYRRSGAKSEPMTTDQIRDAFVGAAGLGDRIRQFHLDRVDRVVRGGTTFPLKDGPGARGRMVVHVVPLSFVASGDRLPLGNVPKLSPWTSGRFNQSAYNFDGYITYVGDPVRSHIQIFRDGILEFAGASVVTRKDDEDVLDAGVVESDVWHAINEAKTFFRDQRELHGPYGVHMTLAVVGGSIISEPPGHQWGKGHKIELGQLTFPDFLIDDVAGEVGESLRPLFEILWQAGGWQRG